MNIRIILFIAGATALTIGGCQKKSDSATATVNITINAPSDGQVFHSGDTMQINTRAQYTGELHGYEVKIVDTLTGTILYDQAQHTHSDKFEIKDTWICGSVTAPAGLRFSVIAYIDHSGNIAQENRMITLAP